MKHSKTIISLFVILFSVQTSIGQDYKSSIESAKNIDSVFENGIVVQEESLSHWEDLVLRSKKMSRAYSFEHDKEWEQIKNELKRNKKKFKNNKNRIHTTRIMDTIFIKISSHKARQVLVDW